MVFHEDWYHDGQIERLKATVQLVKGDGVFMEIGCWEGKSTLAIASTISPRTLWAVDTWQGNLDEEKVTGESHPSVRIAKQRDVFSCFQENLKDWKNVLTFRQDCFEFLESLAEGVRFSFVHLDASHDYPSVKRALDLVAPRMLPDGIVCGDDFRHAHAGRADLQGGVERGVREAFPEVCNDKDFWWYIVGGS